MTELIWSVTEPAAALAAFFAAPLLPKRLVPSTPSVAEMVAPPCLVFLNRPPIVPPIRPPMAAPPGIGTKLPIAPPIAAPVLLCFMPRAFPQEDAIMPAIGRESRGENVGPY